MPFSARRAQTRIKHKILGAYVKAWAGIILTGLGRSKATLRPELVFLDGYAGYGRYNGEASSSGQEPVWGSPIIGLAGLENTVENTLSKTGRHARVSGVFVDKDQEKCGELVKNLALAGCRTPTREVPQYSTDCLGLATVIPGDFREHVHLVLDALPKTAFLLAFVDPYGPSANIKAVGPLLNRPKTDAILLFPSHDVWLRGASATKTPQDLTSVEKGNLTRNDSLYGDGVWRDIATNTSLTKEEATKQYVDLYVSRLRALGRRFYLKSIGLQFSGVETEAYHLILVTEHPDGAMRMNAILREAEIRRHLERWLDMEVRAQATKDAKGLIELDLGLSHNEPPSADLDEPPEEEVMGAIEEALFGAGHSILWGELKGRLADTLYLDGEIRRVLTKLKRQGVVRYSQLKSNQQFIEIGQSHRPH